MHTNTTLRPSVPSESMAVAPALVTQEISSQGSERWRSMAAAAVAVLALGAAGCTPGKKEAVGTSAPASPSAAACNVGIAEGTLLPLDIGDTITVVDPNDRDTIREVLDGMQPAAWKPTPAPQPKPRTVAPVPATIAPMRPAPRTSPATTATPPTQKPPTRKPKPSLTTSAGPLHGGGKEAELVPVIEVSHELGGICVKGDVLPGTLRDAVGLSENNPIKAGDTLVLQQRLTIQAD